MADFDRDCMRRALELAAIGRGLVEPNPMVGAVLTRDGRIVGEGWHRRFGGPHAEVEAIRIAGELAAGATLYVTLEPCCHHGKTPPCVEAVLSAGIARVVIAERDPFPLVDGGGIARLRAAGIAVEVGLEGAEAQELNAPFHRLVSSGRPWLIAKWAMSLDGKIATSKGESRWISGPASREQVHEWRRRVDGILVGRGTVVADDPLLTARPCGHRIATRIVLDSTGQSLFNSHLLRTARETPVLVATADNVLLETRRRLESAGCEVLPLPGTEWADRLMPLVAELGRRRMTNVLIEGGATTLGGFFDAEFIDEIDVYVSPRVIGGRLAPSPVAGLGVSELRHAPSFANGRWEIRDGDLRYSARRC